MDLLEYQAKMLFNNVGIPVLPSQRLADPRDLKRLQIPYPVVIKSQVHVGGRGKAGGIRLVENTIDAIAAARTIFNLPIRGEYPNILLAEAHYDAEQELFLAVVQDYKRQCPVLLGSAQGGIQVEAVLAKIQKVEVFDDFSPFYARKLVHQMGLTGTLLQAVSQIIEKMYQLFVEKDLDLIEINPLAVNAKGEVMALDGKIAANDYGVGRHPDIIDLAEQQPQSEAVSPITWINSDQAVGLITNDVNLAWVSWDLLVQKKVSLGGYGVVPNHITDELLYPPFEEIEQCLAQFAQADTEVVLINCLGNSAGMEQVAQGIVTYWQRQIEHRDKSKGEERIERPANRTARSRRQQSRHARPQRKNDNKPCPHLVVRLGGYKTEAIAQETEHLSIDWTSSLDSAIATVKSRVNNSKES
jgi:succinyl-CoA synthetase beta subunit